MSTTLKTIADQVGVSVRTVSRALNNSGYVKEDLRLQIQRIASDRGYRPNRLAASLRRQESFEIAVLMDNVDALHVAKLASFERVMRESGFATSVLMHQAGSARELLADLLARRPAGLAWFASSGGDWNQNLLRAVSEHALPYVVFGSPGAELTGVDSVSIDRGQGIYDAVHYLAQRGRSRIAYLAHGPTTAGWNATRLQGYLRAMAELGLAPRYVETGGSGDVFQDGRETGRALRALPGMPDAVQGFSDELTLGFLAGLHDTGLRVPLDLALVGFDDRQCASTSWPRLTTVAQPNAEVGEAAAAILLGKLAGDTPPPGGWSRRLPTRLILRETA